jgi:hypothetical protein
MVGPEGVDVPSPIATLLIWQQPHIVMLLEFMYQREQDAAFLQKHWPLVRRPPPLWLITPCGTRSRAASSFCRR